jgi:hypothetical protein
LFANADLNLCRASLLGRADCAGKIRLGYGSGATEH